MKHHPLQQGVGKSGGRGGAGSGGIGGATSYGGGGAGTRTNGPKGKSHVKYSKKKTETRGLWWLLSEETSRNGKGGLKQELVQWSKMRYNPHKDLQEVIVQLL